MRPIAVTAARVAVPAVASAAPATAETGTSNGKTYSVTTAPIEGATPDRLGKWDAEVATLNGGDPAVVEAVNQAGRTCAQDQINEVRGASTAVRSGTSSRKARSRSAASRWLS
jgi:hypothetical protein